MKSRKVLAAGCLAVCWTVLASTASAAVTDPNIITDAWRYTGVRAAPVVLNGGLWEGVQPHLDRTYVLGDVGNLSGLDFVQTEMEGRNTGGEDTWYVVEIDKPGRLFLIIDNRIGDGNAATPPLVGQGFMDWVIEDGFIPIAYSVPGGWGAGEPCTVYWKSVQPGEYILKEQNDGTSRAAYGIAAAPDGWEFPNTPPAIMNLPASVQVPPGETLTLEAVVVDDGLPDPPGEVTVEWTVEAAPMGANVTFDPDTFSENVVVSFSELGPYTLKLAASDSNMVAEHFVEVSVQIPEFAVAAADWIEACNDSNKGPNSSYKPTSYMYIRNHSAPRRRIQFISYDISELKEEGKVFANTYLTMRRRTGHSHAVMSVYALTEDFEMLDLSGKSWNTLPGLQNTPAPPMSEPISPDHLNFSHLSNLLLEYGPNVPAGDAWSDTQASAGLDAFLNADTNGVITLVFVTFSSEDADFEIFARDRDTAHPDTGLGGIQIRGNMIEQTWASNPVPAVNATATQMLSELSWTNPPAVGEITCDVYIGIGEPNYAQPGYGYDVLATGTTGNSVSLEGYPLDVNTTYNWIVDVHDSGTGQTTMGFAWSFTILDNLMPTVSVTEPMQYVWLGNADDPESADVVFEAVGEDDGIPGPLTYLWEQVGTEPAEVSIDPNDVPTLELTLPEAGTYTFRVTVSDGELTALTGASVYVGTDPCDAAQAKPDYVQNIADFNNDCVVNVLDFAMFAEQWLECNPAMDVPCY